MDNPFCTSINKIVFLIIITYIVYINIVVFLIIINILYIYK